MQVTPDRNHHHDYSLMRKPVLNGELGLVVEQPLECCGLGKEELTDKKYTVWESFLDRFCLLLDLIRYIRTNGILDFRMVAVESLQVRFLHVVIVTGNAPTGSARLGELCAFLAVERKAGTPGEAAF